MVTSEGAVHYFASMSITATFKGARLELPITDYATLGELGAAVSDAFRLDASTLKLLSSRGTLVPNAAPGQHVASTCESACHHATYPCRPLDPPVPRCDVVPVAVPRPSIEHSSDTFALLAGLEPGMTVRVLGSTRAEVQAVKAAKDLAGLAGFEHEELRNMRRRRTRAPSASLSLPTGQRRLPRALRSEPKICCSLAFCMRAAWHGSVVRLGKKAKQVATKHWRHQSLLVSPFTRLVVPVSVVCGDLQGRTCLSSLRRYRAR